jgi:hypothetical protein
MNSPDKPPALARWVFWIAGAYGLLILTPFYFMEKQIGIDQPPPITHPEFFYGFIGCALAFQVAFLLIGTDPVRYRAMMIPSVIEKFSYGIACVVLNAQGRLPGVVLIFAGIDLVLGTLFIFSYFATRLSAGRSV